MSTATYDPGDDKIRLYADGRLGDETYARAKAAGFRWAPKQDLFFATWSPAAEDFAIEQAGEIGDEDTSLIDRAEVRAERFEEYSEHRTADAQAAHAAVSRIADNIPLGQPILVGHHSEKHARKDAERIENGMRKAVKMWDTAQYWTSRAAGAIRHAKYKERPDVRARRIKTIEAEKRKQERVVARSNALIEAWRDPAAFYRHYQSTPPATNPASIMRRLVIFLANRDSGYYLAEYKHASGFVGPITLWEAAGGNIHGTDPETVAIATPEAICERAINQHERQIARATRWLTHYENRLAYERAMLAEDGGTVSDKVGPEKGGAVKCWCSPREGWSYIQKVNKVSVTVLDNWGNGGPSFTRNIPFDKLQAIMTAAQVQEARDSGRLIELPEKDKHGKPDGFVLSLAARVAASSVTFHDREPDEPLLADGAPVAFAQGTVITEEKQFTAGDFEALRSALKGGVKVVVAPDLFPTPLDLARRMVALADIEPGHRVLEPSAGTGNLLGAMGGKMFGHQPERGAVVAVEVNAALADRLRTEFPLTDVRTGDFLEYLNINPDDVCPDGAGCPDEECRTARTKSLGRFDRIIMNPPFSGGADIKHIKHALTFLKPGGGRLVALCANGPRQEAALQPLATSWEVLEDAFSEAGTGVRVALLVIDRGEED